MGNSQLSAENNDIGDALDALDMMDENNSSENETIDEELDNEIDNDMSSGEQFVFDAEITNSYIEDGNLSISDIQEAEQIASNIGQHSDAAFSSEGTFDIDTHSGEIIQDSSLHEAYFETGFIDREDMIEAEHEANMQEDWEEPTVQNTYDDDLTDTGEFIQDANLEESYLEDGTFNSEDVSDATHEAYENQEIIDDLFD